MKALLMQWFSNLGVITSQGIKQKCLRGKDYFFMNFISIIINSASVMSTTIVII